VLPEQIHNKFNQFNEFDLGTICELSPFCGLAWGNLHFPGIVGWYSKPKISWFNFLVDLKEQSTQCEKNCTVRIFLRMFKLKNDEIRNDSRFFETA